MRPKIDPHDTDEVRWSSLMKAGQGGDAEALRQLYKEISPVILKYCMSRAGYLGIPEDALQQSLMAMHRNRASYSPERSFRAWMYAIARSKMIDEIRKRSRHSKVDSFDNLSATYSGLPAYSTIEGKIVEGRPRSASREFDTRIHDLHKAIADLDSKYRDAIVLVKIQGYSIREAADKLGISEAAMKARTHRAFKMLTKKVREQA